MTPGEMTAPTNFVPAVAVKRRGLVLSVMTGRKGRVGGYFRSQTFSFFCDFPSSQ